MTAGELADAKADALALIDALVAEDWEAAAVLEAHCSPAGIMTAVMNFLLDEIDGRGIEFAEWTALKRAELLAGR